MVAAGLQRDLDESLRITNHLRGENKRLVENTGGAGKEVERLRAENQRLTAAFADQEERRAEDKARMEGKVEELEAELMRSQLGKRVAETKAAAIGKDLGRTRAQLEGVQEQSGRVQENMREYYSGEIVRLSEELESMGVQVEVGVEGASNLSGAEESDEEAEAEKEGELEEKGEGGGEEEGGSDSSGSEGEGESAKGEGGGTRMTRTPSFFGRLFDKSDQKQEARERRLSSALDLVKEV